MQVPIVRGRDSQDVPADLNLSQLNELIDDGFCGNVVKYTMLDGTENALKCCDKMNNYDGYKMMKNEIKIYQKLKRLQGTLIPHLRFSGYSGEIFLIGTDYIKGKHPDLTKDMIKKLKQKLARYHIDHGDLRKQNIIEDETGKYWVIDFGKSKITRIGNRLLLKIIRVPGSMDSKFAAKQKGCEMTSNGSVKVSFSIITKELENHCYK